MRDTALAASGLLNDEDRRPERAALSAGRPVGGDGVRRGLLGAVVRAEPWAGSLSPRHVHVLEADRAAGVAVDVRRAGPREVHGAARVHQHAAAGADADERSDLRRSGARAGAARAARGRHRRVGAHRLRLPSGDRAQAEPEGSGRSARTCCTAGSTSSARIDVRRRSWSPSASRRATRGSTSRSWRRGPPSRRRFSISTRPSPSSRSRVPPMRASASSTRTRSSPDAPPAVRTVGARHRHRGARVAARRGAAAARRRRTDPRREDRRPHRAAALMRHAPSAIIFLHQSGGPSQLETFDYKPGLDEVPGHADSRFDPPGPARRPDDGAIVAAGREVDLRVRAARRRPAPG